LLANNKKARQSRLQTIKKMVVEDDSCLFCIEQVSTKHLFFLVLCGLQSLEHLVEVKIGPDFESVAKLWLSNKKYKWTNVFTSAALWSL
jgi:hypothetical protein